MNYRDLGNIGLAVSEIGLGGEWLTGLATEQVDRVIDAALAEGINCLDIFMPQPETRSNIGHALRGRREKMLLQGHLGAIYEDGQYTRSRQMDKVKAAFDDLLTRLSTDYIDIGMLHYIDNMEEYQRLMDGEFYAYACQLRDQGVIRHIGLSSHNPQVSLRAVEEGRIQVLMFSINPAYDLEGAAANIEELMHYQLLQSGQWTADPARQELYARCAAKGVGITVMKPLGAGSLLRAESSPFGAAMTVVQCCHYCLTRPGVASVLVGCRTPEQVQAAARYATASLGEKAYGHIYAAGRRIQMTGRCMYCNHCQPCPVHIDVAEVTKFLDLARQQEQVPETVRDLYLALAHHAGECIQCGSCEGNCPFGVQVRENMAAAQALFGC